jgi:TRAP-type mannitol/chloroaromatic compound transport system permease large subunit
MTGPEVAVLQLGVLVIIIMLGFPVAYTLMALGIGFGFYAYYESAMFDTMFNRIAGEDPGFFMSIWAWFRTLVGNRVFDLFVNKTYSVMANDTLTAIPLFLFMGYVVERANIVTRLFSSIQIAARGLPGSLAVAALITCALFATATGIVGAVVTLIGLLALPSMLRARYNIPFATGAICSGGCLGILIPPSIMLIVYGATAGVSVVRLYAGAMIPGFLLAGLYIIYVVFRASMNKELAPKLPDEEVSHITTGQIFWMLLTSFFPLAFLILAVLGAILMGWATPSEAAALGALGGIILAVGYRLTAIAKGEIPAPWSQDELRPSEKLLYALGYGGVAAMALAAAWWLLGAVVRTAGHFIGWLGGMVGLVDAEAGPTGIVGAIAGLGDWIVSLLMAVLAPGVAVAVALIIAAAAYFLRSSPLLLRLQPSRTRMQRVFVFAGEGALIGVVLAALYWLLGASLGEALAVPPYFIEIGLFLTLAGWVMYRTADHITIRDSIYLTARTTAMVCWLFVGSGIFASVFAYLGGQEVIGDFVVGLELTPLQFLLLAQFIIFLLGWPLEWTEIIIIFIPIFLPLLAHFEIDPLFFGILVALNLQTAFLSPPMAMSAYYLKGISPPEVRLAQIFNGCMPYMLIVVVAMIIVYVFPATIYWLPNLVYNR